jgi:hypothetical protein
MYIKDLQEQYLVVWCEPLVQPGEPLSVHGQNPVNLGPNVRVSRHEGPWQESTEKEEAQPSLRRVVNPSLELVSPLLLLLLLLAPKAGLRVRWTTFGSSRGNVACCSYGKPRHTLTKHEQQEQGHINYINVNM